MNEHVIVVRSEADSVKNAASLVHVEVYGSVTTPGPVVARDRTASYRRSSPVAAPWTIRIRLITFRVAKRYISHSRRVCKAACILFTWYAVSLANSSHNPAIYFFARWSLDYHSIPRNCELRMCLRARARGAMAPAYVMTAITYIASALWNAP